MNSIQWLELFVLLSAVGFWVSILYRISHPYKCNCNASFLWFAAYRKHINMKHGVI